MYQSADPGHPARDDAAPSTATALVLAARRLFARHGYHGTSVRAITREAGANLGAVTYHFGSKRALYEAAVASILEPFAARVEEAAASPAAAPLDRIEAVVRAYFDLLREYPELPPLVLQELIAGGAPPMAAAAALRRILGVLVEEIREGQEDGTIRAGDAPLMAVSAVTQPIHLTVARRMIQAVLGVDQEDPGTRERVVQHAVEFVRSALRGAGDGRGGGER